MKGISGFFFFLLLVYPLMTHASHNVYSGKLEYRFVHPDSLEIMLTITLSCNSIVTHIDQYYEAQLLHIARGQDTLKDSLEYCNSYANNAVCPDSMSRCFGGKLLFSTAIFEYKKIFPLSFFNACEMTFFWQGDSAKLPLPERGGLITTGHESVPIYIYAYLNYCTIAQPNSPRITRNFPDVMPYTIPIKYNYGITVDEPEDDSVYIDLILPKTWNGVDKNYLGSFSHSRPLRFSGYPNNNLSLPLGFHIDNECGLLEFTATGQNEVSTLNLRIQRFVRRNDSVYKVSELNYDHIIRIENSNAYKYYFPTPPIYHQTFCVEKSVYVPLICGTGPREPGPQKICTRDSVLLETPFHSSYAFQWYKNGLSIPYATQSIYWASDSGTYRVAVVNEETGCNKLSIEMQVLIDDGTVPVITYDSMRPYCESDTALIFRDSTQYSWVQWRKNDKPFSMDSTLVFPAISDGSYALDVVNQRGCRVRSNTLNIKINTPNSSPLFDSTAHLFCGSFSDTILTTRPLLWYNWLEPVQSEDSFLIVNEKSMVILEAMDTLGCMVLDSIALDYYPDLELNLGNDSLYCFNEAISQVLKTGVPALPDYRYQWNGVLADSLPEFVASDTGLYWVLLQDGFGCFHADTLSIGKYPPILVNLGGDTLLCGTNTLLLEGGSHAAYSWSDGSTLSELLVESAGNYSVEVKDDHGCSEHDSIFIAYSEPPIFVLDDSVLCETDYLLLEAPENYPEYLWSTGNRTYQAQIKDTGLVWLRVKNECGNVTDSAWIRGCRYEPLDIFIPNVFSPNSDQLNEGFYIYIDHYREFNVTIYNRWGQQIFESDTPTNSWDGTFRGVSVEQDVYFYILRVLSLDGRLYSYNGNITVIR
ncbi:MAG TPA: hypothetical protein DIW47_10935 [Bacteroidetes bacterium]|nr:hypothetical protein [Bacteroidota bacterium]